MEHCPNCGAPLPAGAPGTVEHCTFCGAETRVAPAPEPASKPRPMATPDARPVFPYEPSEDTAAEDAVAKEDVAKAFDGAMRRSMYGTLLFAGLIVAAGLAIAVVTVLLTKHRGSATSTASSPSASAKPQGLRVLTPAALATLPVKPDKTMEYAVLDAPGMTGDYAAFDLASNLDWAAGIAKAWSSDATLWRVHVQRAGVDGTIDVVGHSADVILEYNSVAKGDLDLMLEIHHVVNPSAGRLDVSISSHADTTARDRLPTPKCPLTKAFAAARSHGLADARPQEGVSISLVGVDGKPYWALGYAVGKPSFKGVETWIDGMTCVLARRPD